jgi:hypothetical protein
MHTQDAYLPVFLIKLQEPTASLFFAVFHIVDGCALLSIVLIPSSPQTLRLQGRALPTYQLAAANVVAVPPDPRTRRQPFGKSSRIRAH